MALEDAHEDQPLKRIFADFVGVAGDAFHPEARVVPLLRRDVGKGMIEQVVAGRRRVDQNQVLQVGVYPVLQREVHQHAARQGVVKRPTRHACEPAVLVSKQKQQRLLYESKHIFLPFLAAPAKGLSKERP